MFKGTFTSQALKWSRQFFTLCTSINNDTNLLRPDRDVFRSDVHICFHKVNHYIS